MSNNNMFSSVTALKNAFFSEVVTGIMTNTILLLSHILIFLLRCRPRPTDLTISHLASVHIVMQFSVGFLVAGIFESSTFWNDFTCKAVIYLNRLMRGLSIGTTCLLSVLQAITLSPRSSSLAKFKQNCTRQSLYCVFFLWVCNLSINVQFLLSSVVTYNRTLDQHFSLNKFCSLWPQNLFLLHVFTTLKTLQDVIFIGLMVLSSGYMVTLLCRHRRSSQHLHSTKLSVKAPPEQRAIQTILILMSFFVLMYFTECIIIAWRNEWAIGSVRLNVLLFLSNGFATISPLVFISIENRLLFILKNRHLLFNYA